MEIKRIQAIPLATTAIEAAGADTKARANAERHAIEDEAEIKQSVLQRRAEMMKVVVRTSNAPWPAWDGLAHRCVQHLLERSLSVNVFAILAEAVLWSDGWAGFTATLDALSAVIERRSRELRPGVDDSGAVPADRFESLARWPLKIKDRPTILGTWNVTLFIIGGERLGLFDLNRLDARSDADRPAGLMAEDIADATTKFIASGNSARWIADANGALSAVGRLQARIQSDLGEGGADEFVRSFSPIDGHISDQIDAARARFGNDPGVPASSAAAGSDALAPSAAQTSSRAGSDAVRASATSVGSHEDVARFIDGAARYFERADAQSPVSYRLRTALRFLDGDMSRLMTEAMASDSERAAVFAALAGEQLAPLMAPSTLSAPMPSSESATPSDVSLAALAGENTAPAVTNAAAEALTQGEPITFSTRSNALKAIAAARAYLQSHEPHNFAQIPLELAEQLATMPLLAMLQHCVTDPSVRGTLMQRLGASLLRDPDATKSP